MYPTGNLVIWDWAVFLAFYGLSALHLSYITCGKIVQAY